MDVMCLIIINQKRLLLNPFFKKITIFFGWQSSTPKSQVLVLTCQRLWELEDWGSQTDFYWGWMEPKMGCDVLTLQCSSNSELTQSFQKSLKAEKHSAYPAFSANQNKLN